MGTTATRHTDPGFYQLVHELIKAEKAEQSQREGKRRKYSCIQLVAPYEPGRRPDQSDFRHVECHDLSDSGFSYYSVGRPSAMQLVVALGPVPFVFVTAEVVRHTHVSTSGRSRYLVGCRFTGRFEE